MLPRPLPHRPLTALPPPAGAVLSAAPPRSCASASAASSRPRVPGVSQPEAARTRLISHGKGDARPFGERSSSGVGRLGAGSAQPGVRGARGQWVGSGPGRCGRGPCGVGRGPRRGWCRVVLGARESGPEPGRDREVGVGRERGPAGGSCAVPRGGG